VITTAWPVISATLSDPEPGSGVQPLSTMLIIDSGVVTPQVNTASGFAYTPTRRLADGVNSVTAQVYDQAGNQTQSGPWSFTIVDDSAPPSRYEILYAGLQLPGLRSKCEPPLTTISSATSSDKHNMSWGLTLFKIGVDGSNPTHIWDNPDQ
jgi:hypothetical protein